MKHKDLAVPLVFLDLNHIINLAKDKKNGDIRLFEKVVEMADSGKVSYITAASLYFEVLPITAEYQKRDIEDMIR